MRRRFVNISLATRLSLVALVVTLLSLAVTAAVGLVRGSDLADGLADDRLVTVAASRGDLVQIYVTSVRREVAALSASPGTRRAIEELGDAYEELAGQAPSPEATDRLTQHYLVDVVPELERVRGPGVSPSFLVPDGAAIYLQDAYVVPRVYEDGSSIGPALVLDPGDGSAYSALHPEVHQTFGDIGLRSEFDDLLLIDARSDVVVYSVQKRADFATSLDAGPQSGSSLARLIDQIRDDPAGGARLADFAAYMPAGDRATAFVAAPVFGDDGRIAGFVAAALSIDPFDALVSGGGDWDGFGEDGEAYIVGGDGTLRTTSRAFAANSQVYLANTSDDGPAALTDEQRRRMSATGTTALVEEVDRRVLAAAGRGAGVDDTVNYRGVETRTAFRPLEIDDVDWVMFGELPHDELDGPIEGYARNMLLAVALFVVAVTFVAVRWSNRLMGPIRAIAARLRAVRSSGAAAPTADQAVPASGPIEYEELSANVDQMLLRLRQRQDAVDARSAERTELLRQFLPAAVARRTEEGDGDVFDHVRNASVVVLTVDGIGDLIAERPESEVRNLFGEIVDETDALAADLGLERIKLTGATYYAVCGATRPYLDHAPRSVAFALAARDLVDEVGGGRLTARGGVASGSFSVGLAARGGLVYDAWGDTVAAATRLAGRAPAGGIAASPEVSAQLPDEFVVVGDADDGVVVVTARVDRTEATT